MEKLNKDVDGIQKNEVLEYYNEIYSAFLNHFPTYFDCVSFIGQKGHYLLPFCQVISHDLVISPTLSNSFKETLSTNIFNIVNVLSLCYLM